MPSLKHEALLLLFRNRPELAPELLREALGIELPAYTTVRVESAELTEVVPAEYRADLVVLLGADRPVLAIVVEVQLTRDDRKYFTWPVYVAGLRARFKCEAAALVVAATTDVARWAAAPIRLGPGFTFAAGVLGPYAVPVITDPVRAEADPELAVLSVMAHGRGDVELAVQIALAATAGAKRVSDPDLRMLYFDLAHSALSQAARKALQMLPQGYEFQSEILRENTAAAKAEGAAQAKSADVITVFEARGIALSDEQRARILACKDLKVLDQWIRRAVTITTADEL